MPNLLIIQQIQRNTKQVLSCLYQSVTNGWACIDKYSTKFANGFNKQIVGRIIRKANKHKKCLRVLAVILAVLALMTGLFMGSFKSAGSREQGFEVNYTEEVFKETYLTNDWKYTGLNGYIKTVPKQKILVQFSKSKQIPSTQLQTHQIYPAIQARVIQGTKLIIQASFQCSIVILQDKNKNMKLFFDMYGFRETPNRNSELQWMTYLKQKMTNMIVQTIGKESFYSITNKGLRSSINDQFAKLYANFNTTFPFKISLLTLTVNYPENSFSANNTLGSQLMRTKSLLNQLNNQYQTIQSYIDTSTNLIKEIYVKNAQLKAQMDSRLLNIYSYDGWIKGLGLVKDVTGASTWPNSTNPQINMEKFMWLYFNTLYNATYKAQRVKALANGSINLANSNIQNQFIIN